MPTQAMTRYMDGVRGAALGAPWESGVRLGASCDCLSVQVRRSFVGDASLAPDWRPNPEPSDDDWGGDYGKPCAHNEVVMHALRPFAPLEVLNTKCCSRASPAPGNVGFDGCLEFLRARCRRKRRPCTVWDVQHFSYIHPDGAVQHLQKKDLLSWHQRRIDFFLPALRRLTVATQGAVPTAKLITTLDALIAFANAPNLTFKGIPRTATIAVLAFVLGGDPATWRAQYAAAPADVAPAALFGA